MMTAADQNDIKEEDEEEVYLNLTYYAWVQMYFIIFKYYYMSFSQQYKR